VAPAGSRTHLSLADFLHIVDQLPAIYRLKLVGLGEPLLNPEFFEMVRAARGRGIRVITTTNGSLLDGERRGELLGCGLSVLNVSVDAANPETHARVRPGSDLEQIGEGVAALVRERGRRKAPRIRVWHVTQREAVAELPDLVSLCASWGVDALLCTAKITNFGSSSLEGIVRERRALAADLQRAAPEARRRAAQANLRFTCPEAPPRPRSVSEGAPCRWPWGRTFITARGEVIPCPYASGPDGVVLGCLLASCHPERSEGSVSVGQELGSCHPFAEIWNGPAMRQLREQVRDRRNPAFCRACYGGWEGPPAAC
jgi:pyrroloquinoline quinone biosynthesis protein E